MDCLPSRKGHCINHGILTTQTPALVPVPSPVPISEAATVRDDMTNSSPPSRLPDESDVATSSANASPDDASVDEMPGELSGAALTPPADHFPSYAQLSSACFKWGSIDGPTYQSAVNSAYNEIVHWRRNIFKVPSGKVGKSFVRELGRLFKAYAEGTTLESVALTAAMTLPSLLLQKPHRSSKAKEHVQCLERRMKLWTEGDLEGLLREGHTIQQRLLRTPHSSKSEQHCVYFPDKREVPQSLLMKQWKIQTVRDILKQKHPEGKPVTPSAVVDSDPSDPSLSEPHPVIFEQITGSLVRSVALRTEGAVGPSGIDAQGWRRLCSSFQHAFSGLCDALACVCKRICSTYVDPCGLTAFVACRLIALNKCPGVRPIGIGEVVRRILGKVILATIGDDIQEAAGPLQVCAGQQAGCEAAVHAMREISDDSNTDAVLLVDASNAFNTLNWKVALLNIQKKCPPLAKVLINTYRHNPQLFVGGEAILSQEGTTQGDPLAMAMYAIGTLPLIHRLNQQVTQVWHADDATAGGRLHHLHSWWNQLLSCGPE